MRTGKSILALLLSAWISIEPTYASLQEHAGHGPFRRATVKHGGHHVRRSTQSTEEECESEQQWNPVYHRKAIDAHAGGTSCHHFDTLRHHQSNAYMHACSYVKKASSTEEQTSRRSVVNVSHKKSKQDHSYDDDADQNGFSLIKAYSGASFFDDMFFFTQSDPSGGMIQYVGHEEAKNEGLIGVRDERAFMKYGAGQGGHKHAVRVSTKETYTSGIFVLDAVHMPTGCGVWPAFWTNPSNPRGGWPNGGEIDIIEGVHYFSRNMQSIHAPSTCHMADRVEMMGRLAMPNRNLQRNCDPHATDDQGCGIQSQQDGTYGEAYNQNGGGVHAMVWDEQHGISVYFFARDAIPGDIQAGKPDPFAGKWGTPQGHWPAAGCDPAHYFQQHVVVFTNTVCGTWAGADAVWKNKGPGQDLKCAAKTGKSSCAEYMNSNPDLSQAYWEINSLKVYQTKRTP